MAQSKAPYQGQFLNYFNELGASLGPSVQERLLEPLSIWYPGADAVSVIEDDEDEYYAKWDNLDYVESNTEAEGGDLLRLGPEYSEHSDHAAELSDSEGSKDNQPDEGSEAESSKTEETSFLDLGGEQSESEPEDADPEAGPQPDPFGGDDSGGDVSGQTPKPGASDTAESSHEESDSGASADDQSAFDCEESVFEGPGDLDPEDDGYVATQVLKQLLSLV